MATFTILILASLLLFISTTNYVQAVISIDKYVDDPCKTKDNRDGACTLIEECHSVYMEFIIKRNPDNIVMCHFIHGNLNPVVCCPDRIPVVKPSKYVIKSEGGFIFPDEASNLKSTETPIIVPPAGTLIGSKVNKEAGEPCKTVDRENGACTVLLECQQVLNELKAERNYDHLVHCNFIGASPVICCRGKIPTLSTKKQSKESKGDGGGIIFPEDDYDDDYIWPVIPSKPTTTSTTTTTTPKTSTNIGSRGGVGSKAETACSNWKKNASPPLSFQVIGGLPADPGEFPHMAGLGWPLSSNGTDYDFRCGGTLISGNFVLTAAHCVFRPDNRPIIARLGETTINSNDKYFAPVDVGISEFIMHDLYSLSRQYHDIALLRLERTLTFNDVVRPACLYVNKNDIDTDTELYATGWGRTENSLPSKILLKINLTSVPLEVCNDNYRNLGSLATRKIPYGLIDSQLCAHDSNLKKDTCDGDSGGPLQIKSLTSQVSTVVGVVSFGLGCATTIPGVYARVSFYMQWIEKIVWP